MRVMACTHTCLCVCVSDRVRKMPVGATKKCQYSIGFTGLPERPVSTFVIYL